MPQDFITRTSTQELERRWSAVREAMAQQNVDAIVMQGHDDWLGGYVRWFTDVWAVNGYPRTVIFYPDRPMTVVEMGARDTVKSLQASDPVHRGVDRVLCSPSFFSVGYSPIEDAKLVCSDLQEKKVKRLGVLTPQSLRHSMVTQLQEHGVELIDLTDTIDVIKAVKSDEEIDQIKACCKLQDDVFSAVLRFIKPGLRDIEVTNFAQAEAHRLGSDNGLFLCSSAKLGSPARFKSRQMQGKVIEAGEHFSMLIEVNGPGSMYAEVARTIVIGEATQKLKDEFAMMKEAQSHTLSYIKPGAHPKDIAEAHDQWMQSHGLPPERRLYAHGQGYDLVERPLIRADETMPLAANMNLAVHPGYDDGTVFAVICDNYLVTETGVSDCLHTTPKQIFEI
ncbi:MAG: M24 family metallopeptidase [Gammaproteobacteria bacterium]|nr:M24 family metallopeptidase [Gammaproteobacteria bacterium]